MREDARVRSQRGGRVAVARLERCGGQAVGEPLGDPPAPRRSGRVGHDDRGLVADLPALCDEPPDEVDVLADAEVLVEPVAQGASSHDQRRGGHEGDCGAGPDDSALVPEVEWGGGDLKALADRVAQGSAQPWRDRADLGVREVPDELVEPVGLGHDVGVEERDERRGRARAPSIAGGGGSERHLVAHEGGVVRTCDAGDRAFVGGAVVDDGHPQGRGPREHAEQRVESSRVVTDGHDHVDLAGVGAARVVCGVHDAGVDEPSGQRAGHGVGGHGLASEPGTDEARALVAEADEAPRRAARDEGVGDPLERGIAAQAGPSGEHAPRRLIANGLERCWGHGRVWHGDRAGHPCAGGRMAAPPIGGVE